MKGHLLNNQRLEKDGWNNVHNIYRVNYVNDDCWHSNIYEQDKSHGQLSWERKMLYDLRARPQPTKM